MQGFSWNDLNYLVPEIELALGAFILLMGIAFSGSERSKSLAHWLGVLLLLHCAVMTAFGPMATLSLFSDMIHLSPFTQWVKALILGAGGLTLLLSRRWLLTHPQAQPEFVVLTIFSVLGLMLLVSSADFLSLYVSLELSSLALYVLAAIQRDDAKSSEAGVKYFVLGALASCMLLFGISLVYGTTGTTNFDGISKLLIALHAGDGVIPSEQLAFVLGLVLVLIGAFFKISAVPFHMWTPDVYHGSPTVVTAYFANAPKIGSLMLLVVLLNVPFVAAPGYWQQIVGLVAVASMLVGAWGAITQKNIKRLLAYSSIGHVGFVLVGLTATGVNAVSATLLYMVLYAASSIGAFGIILLLTRNNEPVELLSDLRGLSRRFPMLAFAFAAFLFSMAGIPPLAGFFGKFYVFMAAVEKGFIGLAVVGVLASVVSCFYYLKIVKIMYFDEAEEEYDAELPFASRLVVGICALVTLGFVVYPAPLKAITDAAAAALLR
jgi:NADH-quinone oxidoreductase subunit N